MALVTGGGTNLGKAAAAELVRCGPSVVIAGRRQEVLEAAAAEIGALLGVAGDIRDPAGAEQIVGPRSTSTAGSTSCSTTPAGSTSCPAESITTKGWQAVQRLNVGGHARDDPGGPRAGDETRGRGDDRERHRLAPPRDAGDGAHRDGAGCGRGVDPRSRRRWEADGIAVGAIALGRFATESLRKYPAELWRRAAASVPLQRLGTLEEYGWLVALLASPLGRSFSGSVVTIDGALDNWSGPWPPPDLTRDGEVPIEERRPAGR